MARILVVDDEQDLLKVLTYNLAQAGHEVAPATGGREALQLAKESKPELVILDLMLPDLPGIEVCKALKRDPGLGRVPVLILTAKGEEIDRVVGFELGADDYVVKPFSVRELMLRIDAILRRSQSATDAACCENIAFGELLIDRGAHRVWVSDQEVELTVLEFKLLVTLYERRNRVQNRATLLADVWAIDASVTTRTVDTHVKRLREKLGSAGDYVETVRGIGYRFAEHPHPPAPAPTP